MPPPESRPPALGAEPLTAAAFASWLVSSFFVLSLAASLEPSVSSSLEFSLASSLASSFGASCFSGLEAFSETAESSFEISSFLSPGFVSFDASPWPRLASIAWATLLFLAAGIASEAGSRAASKTFSPASPPMRSIWQRRTKLVVIRSFEIRDFTCSAAISGTFGQSRARSSNCPRTWMTPHCTSSLERMPLSMSFSTRTKQRLRPGGGHSSDAERARLTNSWRHCWAWSFRIADAFSSPGKGGSSSLASSIARLN
mmetsp:Transcript_36413/g.87099  ORF Transcript_36413/g.87099 Transcript_36413/m.87099 type:complete len:257 (+) Transcript_36413:1295-2065(+)